MLLRELIEKEDGPRGFAKEQNQLPAHLEATRAKLKLMPLGINLKNQKPNYLADESGRYIVVVSSGGKNLPFYFSTGDGGKKTVQPDKWYPFFGCGGEWFNKGSSKDINNYYGSSIAKSIAQTLNSTLPRPVRHKDHTLVESMLTIKNITQIYPVVNKDMDPAKSSNSPAADIQKALAKGYETFGGKPLDSEAKPEAKPEASAPKPEARPDVNLKSGQILLVSNGKTLTASITTDFGKNILKHFGSEYNFSSEKQFSLQKVSIGWRISIPASKPTNATMVNGKELTTTIPLKSSDVITIGNPAKGIHKLPITVYFDN